MLISALLGLIYSSIIDGFGVLYPHINTALIGILGGGLISYLEFYFFSTYGKRLKFISIVAIRMLVYVIFFSLIIFSVLLISRVIRLEMSFQEVMNSEEFQHYLLEEDFSVGLIYAIVFVFIINFNMLISRKMGKGVLLGIITGKNYQPHEIELIFMFLNIRYSDQIVEKIGRLKFHEFLRDFFYDITEPILDHKGVIHEYVEDQLVVSWEPEEGLDNANCVRTFYDAQKKIKDKSEYYFTNYGFVPQFIAGFHIGDVIKGELGDVKSTISFFGDVMNTTSRIQGQCKVLDKEIVLSVYLEDRLELPRIYNAVPCGQINLKGKREPMELFSIQEKSLADLIAS